MNSPADRKYSKTHEWARLEADGTVSIGITDHAQEMLGDIVFVELPAPGSRLAAGAQCAVVESVKAAADIYTPVSGKVVTVNGTLADSPQAINEDAGGAWIFRLEPETPDAFAADFATLLDAAAYDALVQAAEK